MYECFVSSKLAAAAVLDLLAGRSTSLEAYESAVETALMPLHNASWRMKQAFDRWPRLSWRVARTQMLWQTVERLLLGELAAPAEQRGLARIPLRALDVLGRRP
jgi:flavin-dependent dehydrogenase